MRKVADSPISGSFVNATDDNCDFLKFGSAPTDVTVKLHLHCYRGIS